jgi:transketolase
MTFNKELVKSKATEIRKNSLKMVHAAASGHPGGSLSIADILSVLYFGAQLKHSPNNPEADDRDILVVSKGHSSPAVYSALGLAGFFPVEDTLSFRRLGSQFQGHIDRMKVPGVEMSTGSLGHGLSNALGIALASKLNNNPRTVYAILSDGELQEGSSWEAIMACAHYQASNLICFIDRNRIQLDGWTETTMALHPIAEKFNAFNWHVIEIDGHDHVQINNAINEAKSLAKGDKPICILAQTIKGKGVSFMEDNVAWHGVAPKDADLEKALAELS